MPENFTLQSIGVIRSELVNLADAPRQGDEGQYTAWLDLNPDVARGLVGIAVGDKLVVLSWLHQAERAKLQVHPRGDATRPLTGVFATRAPHRPNPIGLHEVTVLDIEDHRLHVAPIEAIDGTPILDIKPVLSNIETR